MIEGDLKQEPVEALAGATPRHVMQTLGTDWARDMIAPEFWSRAWTSSAKAALARGAPGIVVEDCRFPNEAEAIRALGGRIIRILRPADALLDVGAHPSEKHEI